MPPEMWLPALVMVLGYYCFFATLLLVRMRNEVIATEYRTEWVREYLEKKRVL